MATSLAPNQPAINTDVPCLQAFNVIEVDLPGPRRIIDRAIMETLSNGDNRLTKVIFTESGAVFYQGENPSLYIEDLFLGYEGNSPATAGRILSLLGVSERMFRDIQVAARCKGTIAYTIVVEQCRSRKSIFSKIERLVFGENSRPSWTWKKIA